MNKLLPCPFCGEIPEYPDGKGTQYEIWCNCGMAVAEVQISDLMTQEERMNDKFTNYRYEQIYIDRAKKEITKMWNNRRNNDNE